LDAVAWVGAILSEISIDGGTEIVIELYQKSTTISASLKVQTAGVSTTSVLATIT
jgi:hypothetical protein